MARQSERRPEQRARQVRGRTTGSAAERQRAAARQRLKQTRSQARRATGRGARDYRREASNRLKRFRRGSALAVAITGLVLIVAGIPDAIGQQADAQPSASVDTVIVEDTVEVSGSDTASVEAARGAREATQTVRELTIAAYRLLPKLAVAIAILLAAAIVSRVVRTVLRRVLSIFERAEASSALVGVAVWLVALGAALSVLAGDARALIGSVGLFGLALSWALQAPIESFTGWLLNSFRGYYRIGDRIAVGEVFGDVYRIDFLTTTVWEAGGPGKPVHAAQPTGALVTFPNSEVLRSNITNFTYYFAWVWDEVPFGVANESDIAYAADVTKEAARRVFGETMKEPAAAYERLLERAGLDGEVSTEPQVFISMSDAWTDLTVRYLVPARQRRKWSSRLVLEVQQEHAKPEHAGRIIPAYPVTRIEVDPTHVRAVSSDDDS